MPKVSKKNRNKLRFRLPNSTSLWRTILVPYTPTARPTPQGEGQLRVWCALKDLGLRDYVPIYEPRKNNRAELDVCLRAIQLVKGRVVIVMDSE